MSRLNELIQELCPDGVEYETIKETVGVNRGKRLTKSQLSDDGKYEVYHGSKDSILGKYYEYNAPANTVIVINTGGIGGVKFLDKPFWCSDGSFWLGQSSRINNKYLYYYLSGYENYFYSQKRVGGVPTIERRVVEDFKIPIPPLDVQNEIVRILDTFTSHTAELQAELQARKEQYDYYKQFIFKSKISHYKNYLLKNIASFSQGIQVNPSCQYNTMQPGRIRFLRIVDFVSDNEPYRYIERPEDKYIKTEEELIMIRYGASAAGKVFMCHTGAIANNMFKINLNPGILPKYVMYYLSQTSIYTLLNTSGGKSTMPAINFKLVGSINIPIPPLSEQQRIVSILDKFEALVNDLTAGLPAEIAAVQEQYEYYRNKLLTFKDVGTYHGASST